MAGNLKQTATAKYNQFKPVLMIVGILFVSIITNNILTDIKLAPILHYDPANAKTFEVTVSLKIQMFNEENPQWLALTNIDIDITDDPDKRFTSQEYLFLGNTSELNASWSYLHIYYFIPKEAYDYFAEIECQWVVENKEGWLKKSSSDFEFNGNDYVAFDQWIDNAMAKLDVPDQVESKIKLYSR